MTPEMGPHRHLWRRNIVQNHHACLGSTAVHLKKQAAKLRGPELFELVFQCNARPTNYPSYNLL
jgi:hypothetical protein